MFLANFTRSLKNTENFSLLLSFLLHGALVLILILNFAGFKNKDFPNQVKIVEIVFPIANKTNLPPAKAKEKKPELEQKERKEPKKTEPVKQESIKQESAKPEPVKQEVLKKTTQENRPRPLPSKEAQKPGEKKEQKVDKQNSPKEKKSASNPATEEKTKKDTMDDLLKSLEGDVIQKAALESELDSLNSSDSFDDTQSLSISEIDAIKSQIQKCWTEPAGGLKKDGLSVLLKIKLLIDGNVEDIKVKEAPKSENTIMNQLAIDTAIRAIKMCAPYKMPMNSYNSWKELEIMFDPREM